MRSNCNGCPHRKDNLIHAETFVICHHPTTKDTSWVDRIIPDDGRTPDDCPEYNSFKRLYLNVLANLKVFAQLIAMLALLVFACWGMYLFHHWSRATMHDDLAADMVRNGDAGIPCRNPRGRFYLYTSTTTYDEWERYHTRNETP